MKVFKYVCVIIMTILMIGIIQPKTYASSGATTFDGMRESLASWLETGKQKRSRPSTR